MNIGHGFRVIQMLVVILPTLWKHPAPKKSVHDIFGRLVGDKMEVNGVATVKQNAFHQGHDCPRAVVTRTNNSDVDYLAFRQATFLRT